MAVAGGTGFLGSHIIDELKEKGYETCSFSRRTGLNLLNYKTTLEFLREKQPDVVINSAAHVGGIEYNRQKPIELYEDNILMNFNLIKASSQVDVKKLINIIPNCTYPGEAKIFKEDEWWNGSLHDSVQTYAMARKASWVQCWAYKEEKDFSSIHLILPNLYGPRDHFDPIRSHALGALIRKIMEARKEKRDTVEIWGSGEPIREWGFVKDASRGIVKAMENYSDIQPMNLGEGKGYTIKKIAYLIKEAASWEGRFTFDTSRPDGAPKKVMNVSKMKNHLNWTFNTDLKEGIKRTVTWYQNNKLE